MHNPDASVERPLPVSALLYPLSDREGGVIEAKVLKMQNLKLWNGDVMGEI